MFNNMLHTLKQRLTFAKNLIEQFLKLKRFKNIGFI